MRIAVGTELPMGVEKAGNSEVRVNWVRGMPPALQTYLKSQGKNPSDPAVIKEIYKGIFKRIMATHHLDYYWLWTYERFQYPGEEASYTEAQIRAIKQDIGYAKAALEELGNPFRLGMAGWMLGSEDKPNQFEDALPSSAPFMGLWDKAHGFDELSEDRIKWPATWFEEDWGLMHSSIERR